MDYRRTFGYTHDEFCGLPAWVVRNDRTMLAIEKAVLAKRETIKSNHLMHPHG